MYSKQFIECNTSYWLKIKRRKKRKRKIEKSYDSVDIGADIDDDDSYS